MRALKWKRRILRRHARDSTSGSALIVTCASQRVMRFVDSYGIAMPIAREVDGVINDGATPEDAYRGLATETPGHEVHGAGF
jgi:glycerol-3-phosphate dehydrogenase